MIRFQQMTNQEFQAFRDRSLNEYIDNMSKNYDMPIEKATENATKQFEELLKDGLNTENQYILHVVDDETNENVGMIWYNYKEQERQIFIYEIWMDPDKRRMGYGTQTLDELHNKAKDLGANNVGLHVFGQNNGAIALYKKLGYEENSIVMSKKL
ncbi:GNAT family N-acetyltransferase [Pseudalkalibacillus sp. R45]|uniref:GNAT family N-acetyltransferase n=1 Tax=Pseudalkalibacillus sp. R45 TaxID=3457433 RepID=UPI003FCCFBFD